MKTRTMPKTLRQFLKDYPTLNAVQQDRRDDDMVFDIVCTVCKEEVYVRTMSIEAGTFDMYNGVFQNRKLNLCDTEIELRCSCPNASYAPPESYEVNW